MLKVTEVRDVTLEPLFLRRLARHESTGHFWDGRHGRLERRPRTLAQQLVTSRIAPFGSHIYYVKVFQPAEKIDADTSLSYDYLRLAICYRTEITADEKLQETSIYLLPIPAEKDVCQ